MLEIPIAGLQLYNWSRVGSCIICSNAGCSNRHVENFLIAFVAALLSVNKVLLEEIRLNKHR